MNSLFEELKKLRREFHSIAESGFLEFQTTLKIVSYLKEYGYEDIRYGKSIHSVRMGLPNQNDIKTHIEGIHIKPSDKLEAEVFEGYTGALAVLDFKRMGPTIAFRFDIDANKGLEQKSIEHRPYVEGFVSKNDGAMHSCGHDGHIAIGLMLAKTLKENSKSLCGKILFIFQPAEEGVRGAKSLVDSKILEGVDYLFSGHIGFGVPKGEIVCGVTGFLGTTKIDIDFFGCASHAGANPEKGKNALLAACTTTLCVHTMCQYGEGMSRVNVGVLKGGSDRNIIADFARIEMELRGDTQSINDDLKKRIEEAVKGCAYTYGVDYKMEIVGQAPAYNTYDGAFVDYISDIVRNRGINVKKGMRFGASEDITYMFERVIEKRGKCMYLLFGTELYGEHHANNFDFDEEVLEHAFYAYLDIVNEILK